MNVSPVGSSAALAQAVNTQGSPAATKQAPRQQEAAAQAQATPNPNSPASSAKAGSSHAAAATVQELVQASSVPASIMQRALGDGDGRTGVTALNDGDAAARAAKLAAKMG